MNHNVLVIDDDPNYTQIIKHFLEDRGFNVILCYDGSSALKRIVSDPPEVIL
jgi:DNA-binding response OmpR family regulator